MIDQGTWYLSRLSELSGEGKFSIVRKLEGDRAVFHISVGKSKYVANTLDLETLMLAYAYIVAHINHKHWVQNEA